MYIKSSSLSKSISDKNKSLSSLLNKDIKSFITGYFVFQSTDQNKLYYFQKEILQADKARRYQAILGWPSEAGFKDIVSKNWTVNCDITVDDIERAQMIYGTPVPLLKKNEKATHSFTSKIDQSPFTPSHCESAPRHQHVH